MYREAIKDLLNPSQTNMAVREHPSRGIYVDGLTEVQVASAHEIMDVINLGDSARAVASTNMNAVSSRSHSVFVVTVAQVNEEGSKKQGKLNLVDLAGSEKIGKTGASGQTLVRRRPAACAATARPPPHPSSRLSRRRRPR